MSTPTSSRPYRTVHNHRGTSHNMSHPTGTMDTGMTDWHHVCDNCGVDPRRNPWSRECEACARYRKRTGSPRPLYLIERQLERRQQGP